MSRRILFYIGKRLLLMLPTLFGISILTFVIVNLAPGGPVDRDIQAIRFGSAGASSALASNTSGQSVPPEVVEALRKQYGFDKPLLARYVQWVKNLATFNFGKSFVYGRGVNSLILERLPVSLQFGISSFVLTYTISILLAMAMAWQHGRGFDTVSQVLLIALSSIPVFILGILLLVLFAGGSFFDWFPAGYLQSDNYAHLDFWSRIWDRVHHFILPLICYTAGSFTVLTLLGRNSLNEELHKDYVAVARAKGAGEFRLIAKHALRNAIIPLITGIGGILGVFLSGSVLVEGIFQLQGIGLLGFQSILSRDYNVIMGLVFWSGLALFAGNLMSDLIYAAVDPRVTYE
jgi:microcin C transport system permease protein